MGYMSTTKLNMRLWPRLWRHWIHPRQRVSVYFPVLALQQLTEQIARSEQRHTGQLRFVIESSLNTASLCHHITARQRARYWFSHLGVWDTTEKSGILVYVLFADRAVEIIADRGINTCVDTREWQKICNHITQAFQQQNYMAGLSAGLDELTELLVQYFPRKHAGVNELADEVILR
jgi:uncharacterized membrane protein YgcG